jgi:hypothetical protein
MTARVTIQIMVWLPLELSRSTFSLDVKLPMGYSLVTPVSDILNQAVFSEVVERLWRLNLSGKDS